MSSFGAVAEPWWSERPVAIVGTGPSLKGFNLNRLRGFHVLAVKGAIFDIPWADAGFGLDYPRFQEWKDKFGGCAFPIYWGVPPSLEGSIKAPHPNVTLLKRAEVAGLSDNPGIVNAGGTSGHAALNIAYLKKAKRILLLGFDYRPNGKRSDEWHANDVHYRAHRDQNEMSWVSWANKFKDAGEKLKAAGVTVVNASPKSWISAFPKKNIDEALADFSRFRSEGERSVCSHT